MDGDHRRVAVVMRPRWHNDWHLLAAVAALLLERREVGYPELVAEGRMTDEQATAGIRIMRAIAEDWRAIDAIEAAPIGIDNPDGGGAWPFERRQELARAARHARAVADEQQDSESIGIGIADAVDTLLWWETAKPSARWLVNATLEGRRRANADPAVITERAGRARRIEQRRIFANHPSRLGVAA